MVVATKADRTTQGQLQSSVLRLKESLQSEQILAYSARTGQGRAELWKEIRAAADELQQA